MMERVDPAVQEATRGQAPARRTIGRIVQRRMVVGAVSDPAESDADRIADEVMRVLRRPSAGDHPPVDALKVDEARGTRVARATAMPIIRRVYTDIPDAAQWKADSSVSGTKRSAELQLIGDALDAYDLVRADTDLRKKRDAIKLVQERIMGWESSKGSLGVRQSVRKDPIDDLKTILDAELRTNLAAHATQLAPLAAKYTAAAKAKNFNKTRTLAAQIDAQHYELLAPTASAVLTTTNDNKVKATILFTPPSGMLGVHPYTLMGIKSIASWAWLRRDLADRIIEHFIVPFSTTDPLQVVPILGHRPFREALLATATPAVSRKLVREMPGLRIAEQTDRDAAANAVGAQPTVEEIADACFAAFLGDAPRSGLGYKTVADEFEANAFILGDSAQGKRASCMKLSVMLNAVMKMVLPNDPAATVNNPKDGRPMLTNKLSTIGAGNGILTRDRNFRGNVDQYGNDYGFRGANRIFFGSGHEWITVGTKEYDPTLGISGPPNTVLGALEPVTWTQKREDKYTSTDNGGMTAVRSDRVPPGGAPLSFNRTVTIT
jgi:hypothetical protein